MIPSLVKRLSKTLSFGNSPGNTSETTRPASVRKSSSSASSDGNIGTLRRQSTKELVSEDDSSSSRAKVSSRSSVGNRTSSTASIRSSSIVKEVSLSRRTSSKGSSRQMSKRLTKPPSRLLEEHDTPQDSGSLTKFPSKSLFKAPSKQPSKTPSHQPSVNRIPSKQSSIPKIPSTSKQVSLSKALSLGRAGSKSSMISAKIPAPSPAKKAKPGGKQLWYAAGTYLTARNEEGGFYLCRSLNNIYNTTKFAKIRWLGLKTGRKKKGSKKIPTAPVNNDTYELVYQDQLDPTAILMEVAVERKGTSFLLNEEDKNETERLLQIAEDVESGKMDSGDVGDDVEEVIQIEYEPPVKRRKLQSGEVVTPKPRGTKTATGERRPRLKKTLSQKERDKAGKAAEREEKKRHKIAEREEKKQRKAAEREEKKQRKRAAASERKRKTPQKEDTTLHPNPSIKVMEKDPLWDTTTHMPYVSKYANSRLAFRAVKLKDTKMLKKLLKDSDRIRSLAHKRNVMVSETPLEFAMKQGNKEALNLLREDYFTSKFSSRRSNSHNDRVLLGKLGTGTYNFRSLGVGRIRPLMASRGAREGNNALTKDVDDLRSFYDFDEDDLLLTSMMEGASKDLLILMLNDWEEPEPGTTPEFYQAGKFISNLPTMLARGHNQTAGEILNMMQHESCCRRMPGSASKVLVAKDVAELPSIPPSAINLNIRSIKGFNMIHLAASNPNTDVLEKVLNSDPNFLVSDVKGRRPIHIAAGCTCSTPLQMLLDKGANPYDADNDGETALHYAIRAGRTKNVEILLKLLTDANSHFVDPTAGKPSGGVNRQNKASLSPLHLACHGGHVEIVKLLVKSGANVESKTSINALSVTPLMYAAGVGNLDMVRCLVSAGAVVERSDRVGRNALMHAAMNGSTSVMSYLLNIGASPNRKDTSGNTPLHYAAAYGWYFSVKLLLDAGANPAVSNDWTTTPLSVAYLKGHQGIVSLLLEDDRVDVNFPNQDGETLLFIACSSEKEKELLEQIQYLVDEKGASCKVVNNAKQTPLHILADAVVYKTDTYEKDDKTYERKIVIDDEMNQVVLDIAKLLTENGCDLTVRDSSGRTAAMKALSQRNIDLAQYLVEKGSPIFVSLAQKDDEGPNTLLHEVAAQFLNDGLGDPNSVITFLTKPLKVQGQKKTFKEELLEMAKMYDSSGFTPLLSACASLPTGSYYSIAPQKEEREANKWEHAATFLKNLVEVAHCDVNAAVRPMWKAFGEPDVTNRSDYFRNGAQGKWTPLFYIAQASVPSFTKQKKHDPCEKGTLLSYILSQGVKVNIYDLAGSTPLTQALDSRKEAAIVKILIEEGDADVNMCKLDKTCRNDKGEIVTRKVPPICLATELAMMDKVEELLKHKINVNAVDEKDDSNALHKLVVKRGSSVSVCPLMEKLLEAGVNPNARNHRNQTPLHLLVNNNAGRINDSFEEEVLLLSRKVDLTVRDWKGKIPLHYVFMKDNNYYNSSQFDPVNLCKLLVKSMKPADLNIADDEGVTALHNAARRGASICAMYLMQKGAKPNVKDKMGNTPLALAVRNKHDSCGSILIQNGADMKSPVITEVPQPEPVDSDEEPLPPEWKWKPLAAVKKPEKETKIPLFQEAIRQELVGISFLMLEWPVEKSGLTLIDAIEMAVKNSQFNVALRLLSTTIKGSAEVCALRDHNRNLLHVLALSAAPNHSKYEQEKLVNTLVDRGVKADAKDKYNCTPISYAAYSKNYDLADILADLPGVLNPKAVDVYNRSLIATSLWQYFTSSLGHQLWEWLEVLLKKKADINKKFDYPLLTELFGASPENRGCMPDYWQNYPGYETTPLIFVLHCQDFTFTYNLLQWGANPNLADRDSLTPLMHAVKLNSVNHVRQLLNYAYDPDVDEEEQKKPAKKTKQPQKKNVFRLKKQISDATFSGSDSESEEEEQQPKNTGLKKKQSFRAVKKTSSVNVNLTDKHGWTALHYVACPLEWGTYDNEELVFVLGKAGAKLDVKNNDGKTPLDLALSKNAPKVAAMLQTLMGVDKKHQKQPMAGGTDYRVNDGVIKRVDYDFHADADKQLGEGEENMEDDKPYEADICSKCQEKGDIVRDDDQDLPYEVLMTKCDAHLGVWGLYNFYQIQLIHQPGKNLYILFTRWGRIGDEGQFQHTPYQTKADGVKEFCKIFREKSGNKWENVKSFVQQPKKYRLVPVEERRPPSSQKKIEFDISTSTKSSLPVNIQKAMKIMCNVEKLQNAYRSININTDVLPFGRFSRDRLLKAKQILDDMAPLVNDIATYRSSRVSKAQEEKLKHQQDCQKVSDLSSDYYQLIPQKAFAYEKLRPLDRKNYYQQQVKIVTNLLDFEISTKMMLGAMFRKTAAHPLDYIYNCMKCKMELMEQDDPMTQYILRYAFTSCPNLRYEGVYKVEREGEKERLHSCGITTNHRLLWHGTSTGNLVSILNRGLVCTPLDAQQTGERFGKGIYFSDLFSKSVCYADYSRKDCNFMLLCEVALGKQLLLTDRNPQEKPKSAEKYDSTVAPGYSCPDPSGDVHLPTGETLPLGNMIREYYITSETGEKVRRIASQTEFIVPQESQVCIRYLVRYRSK